MAAVFLSYSSQDRERVALLAESLRAEGFEVWWDREIPVAVTYEDYIRQQLDTAGAVVVVWSTESVASRYVRWEVRRAERRGVLVPVMIEEADLPPEYFLVQSADLTRWTGDQSDREWRRLVSALVRLVGEPLPTGAGKESPAPEARVTEETAGSILEGFLEVVEAEPAAPEAAPVVEEAPPPGETADEVPLQPLPVPEEAVPITEAGEVELVEIELAPAEEEVAEEGAALAEAEVEESFLAWKSVPEEATGATEPVAGAEGEIPEAAAEARRVVPWYRRWWALAGAGVLLLTAVVVPTVLILSGDGGEEATTTLAVSTTEAVSTTDATVAPTSTVAPTTTVATSDVPDMTWARLPYSDALVPPAGWGVAWGSGRVAVGSDGSGGDEDAAVYVTADGVTWERVPHDEAVFGGEGDQQMRAVTVGGPGLVAVGQDGYGGAVWTSTDGITWERVPDEAGVFGDVSAPREVWGLAAGGPGLVAVGWDESLDGAAAVWTSADGLTWERVPHDEAVFGGNGFQPMQAVALGGPGLVAVGWEESPDAANAAVWTSTDGLTWERVPHDEAAFGGQGVQKMLAVAAAGPGLVAVGQDDSGGDGDAAVWASVDGLTWERVAYDEAVLGGPDRQTMFGLAVVEGLGLIAWGEDFSTPEGKGIWVSPPVPGLEWERVPDSEGVFGGEGNQVMWALAEGPCLVAVGTDDSGGDLDAAVWTSEDGREWARVDHDEGVFGGPGDQTMWRVVAGGPGLVAVGTDKTSDGYDAAVWTSADGHIWQRIPDDQGVLAGDRDQGMLGVTAWSRGLVAVGWDGDTGGAVWTSVDGITWERVPPDVEDFGSGSILGVAAAGPGLVAVGYGGDPTAGMVWTSADGLEWTRMLLEDAAFGGSEPWQLHHVASGSSGVVAVGVRGTSDNVDPGQDALAWTSADGVTWSQAPQDEAVLGGPDQQMMWAVVARGPAFIAVGTSAWVSGNGVTWELVQDLQRESWEGRLWGVGAFRLGLVAVGEVSTGGYQDAAVWISSPPG